MHRLPDPTLSLTLPSLHDDTVLSCRVYHPDQQQQPSRPQPPTPPPLPRSESSLAPPLQIPKLRVGGDDRDNRDERQQQRRRCRRRRRAAIVAHPYAPLGGSCDDAVVGLAVDALLKLGYLVGTFNFRGAHPSGGRTSWTAKPEIADYSSFVGFIVYYIHHLDGPYTSSPSHLDVPSGPPVLLLAGYSYGALITSLLPPLEDILAPLAAPTIGSAAAEIRLRAEHLAPQQNARPLSFLDPSPSGSPPLSPRRSLAVRVGGDEAMSARKSSDLSSRRGRGHGRSLSLDEVRMKKTVHEARDRALPGGKRPKSKKTTMGRSVSAGAGAGGSAGRIQRGGGGDAAAAAAVALSATPHVTLARIDNLVLPQPAYLLISPLRGPINNLATWSIGPSARSPSLFAKITRKLQGRGPTGEKAPAPDQCEAKLTTNPTLAIFGDRDYFVAVSRLRSWSRRLVAAVAAAAGERDGDGSGGGGGGGDGAEGAGEGAGGGARAVPRPTTSTFVPVEVSGAGHFWIEPGVAKQLTDAILEFAGGLFWFPSTS